VFQTVHLRPGETLLVHGDPARQGRRREGSRHRGQPGPAPSLPRPGRGHPDQLPRTGLRRGTASTTAGHGADVILDVIGAKYLNRNLDALAVNGRLIIIGMQGGIQAEPNLGKLMAKRAAIGLRARPLDEKAAIIAAAREHVWPLIENGTVTPVIDRVLPIEAAPKPTASWNPAPTSAKSCSNSDQRQRLVRWPPDRLGLPFRTKVANAARVLKPKSGPASPPRSAASKSAPTKRSRTGLARVRHRRRR